MSKLPSLLTATILTIAGTGALADQGGITFNGEALASGVTIGFSNQLGSTMSLTFTQSNTQAGVWTLSGQYVNNAPNTNCRGTPYPVQGVYFPNTSVSTMSFSVAWTNSYENCNSVTGWTGYLSVVGGGHLQINTDWNLAYQSSTGGAISSGADVFTSTTVSMSKSLLPN